MLRRNPDTRAASLIALIALLATGCDRAPAGAQGPAALACAGRSANEGDPPPAIGIMSSLPLIWPLNAEMSDVLSGAEPMTWQRLAIGLCYAPVPLDTLSPMAGAIHVAPETNPLAGLERLAVIQPRGLSPTDNVALDRWVRAGGRLLLALDPALTGDYDLPLGDPRRPVDTALIPPVVARWGLAVRFDEAQAAEVQERRLGQAALSLALAGEVVVTDPAADCTLLAGGAAARCQVGAGRVTLIADAAMFEHPELAGEGGQRLRDVIVESVE